MNIEDLWKITLAQIEVKLDSPAQFRTWFKDTRLIEVKDKIAKIGVKNSYTRDWLKKRHHLLIQSTLTYVSGMELEPEYVYDKEAANQELERIEQESDNSESAPLLGTRSGIDEYTFHKIKEANLNERYSFTNFVVGSSNRLAHAAATSVANNLGKSYNPLFIYGSTGYGKTHLAQAVARQIIDLSPQKSVYYCASESFLNDMVAAIRTNKALNFRNKYRQLDLLIIDDIHFISNWTETQNEFFNTFNALYQANKQIILTSDRPPHEIAKLEQRLMSRFQGGMVVDISQPDTETRLAILEQKRKEFGLEIPDEILRHIAQIVKTNIRELEGALQKIALYNTIGSHQLTFQEISKILGKDDESKRKSHNPSKILKVTAKEFDLTVSDLKGPRRTKEVAFARQVAMYILREEFGYKLEQTAQLLNRNDHTTVIHAVDKIKSIVLVNATFQSQLENILNTINNLD